MKNSFVASFGAELSFRTPHILKKNVMHFDPKMSTYSFFQFMKKGGFLHN